MARGTRCQAHTHHVVVAEERHHLQPLSRGGQTISANMRYLCANAHSDTHYLLDLIEDTAVAMAAAGGGTAGTDPLEVVAAIPWAERRTYGPGIRDAAVTGWLRYADAFLSGNLEPYRQIWLSSGAPRPPLSHAAPSYETAVSLGMVPSLVEAVRSAA